MGVVPKSSAGWEKGVEAHSHSPDSKLRDNPFADDQPDYEAASVPPASAAFDPEAARYASFQVQQEPAPVACGCGLQFVLCAPPPQAHLTPHEALRQSQPVLKSGLTSAVTLTFLTISSYTGAAASAAMIEHTVLSWSCFQMSACACSWPFLLLSQVPGGLHIPADLVRGRLHAAFPHRPEVRPQPRRSMCCVCS